MHTRTCLSLQALLLILSAWAPAAEKVALRAGNGRFLRADKDGFLRPDAQYPAENESFELIARGTDEIALKGPGDRFLVANQRDGRTPRLGSARAQPGDAETLQIVRAGGNGVALRSIASKALLAFPAPGETVEIYRIRKLPAVLQTALPTTVRGLAEKELAGKQYDKTRTHKKEKYIDLPAPTLHDPKRKKRHQVLGVTEESRVQAQLDGPIDIRIPAMLLLARWDAPVERSGDSASREPAPQGGPGLVLLAIEARLPLRGRVQYKVDDVASASTGYRAAVQLSAVAQVRARRSGGDVMLSPPEVIDLHVSVSRLELSNDLLDAARRQVEQFINRELRHNEARIREKANGALQKAVSSRDVRMPLLGYLGVL
jgi:hypothetical protein